MISSDLFFYITGANRNMAKRSPSKKPKQTVAPAAEVTPPEKVDVPMDDNSTVSVPKDQVRFACPKHGDITNATLHLSFADQEGKKQGQFLYCLHCLNEVLLSLQKSKAIETVQIVVPEEIAAQMGPAKQPETKEEAVPDAADALAALAKETKETTE